MEAGVYIMLQYRVHQSPGDISAVVLAFELPEGKKDQ